MTTIRTSMRRRENWYVVARDASSEEKRMEYRVKKGENEGILVVVVMTIMMMTGFRICNNQIS
jgi:hypothetical protein